MPYRDTQLAERIRAWAVSRAHLFSAPEDYLSGVEDALAQMQRIDASEDEHRMPERDGSKAPRLRGAPRGVAEHLRVVERLRVQAAELAAAGTDPGVAAAHLRRTAGDDPAVLLAAHRLARQRCAVDGGEGALLLAAQGAVEPARANDHRVIFYEGADRLIDEIVAFVDPVLAGGQGAAVVVATPGHRRQLEARLHGRGRHLARIRRQGRYVALDTAELLGELVDDGRLDRRRFRDVVRPQLELAAASQGPVHVYGEMVALLCERGEAAQAVQLEELWNELAEEIPFTLLCGYPTTVFDDVRDAGSLRHVCLQHSEVTPAAG